MNKLIFTESSNVDLSESLVNQLLDENSCSYEKIAWADQIATLLDSLPSGLVFRIGKLRLSYETSYYLAYRISLEICNALKRVGCPKNMKVETGLPQFSQVFRGYQHRTLLPHHESGHASFLSPSLNECPSWNVNMRTFSKSTLSRITSTSTHKLYQGLFISEPGECLSITTFYDLVKILLDAFRYNTGIRPKTIQEVSSWLADNIRRFYNQRYLHKSDYLTIGAVLGGKKLVYLGTPIHYAEAEFDDEQLTLFPELNEFQKFKGSTPSPTERFLNEMISDLLGIDWERFREKYEICVSSERYDFILGNNLCLLHGGLQGDSKRLLERIFLSVSSYGYEYENWLSNMWHVHAKLKNIIF